jgi:hypothetical protein
MSRVRDPSPAPLPILCLARHSTCGGEGFLGAGEVATALDELITSAHVSQPTATSCQSGDADRQHHDPRDEKRNQVSGRAPANEGTGMGRQVGTSRRWLGYPASHDVYTIPAGSPMCTETRADGREYAIYGTIAAEQACPH